MAHIQATKTVTFTPAAAATAANQTIKSTTKSAAKTLADDAAHHGMEYLDDAARMVDDVTNLKVPYNRIDPNSSAGWKSLQVDDINHSFSPVVDNSLSVAKPFSLTGGDGVTRSLYQVEGSHLGQNGIFEWIVNPSGNVTHRVFIPNAQITGIPNLW